MSEIQTNNPPNAGTARVLDEQLLFRGNWAEIVEFSYEDDKKQVRKWEGLHRKHRAEAVIIVARMQPSGRFIIIRQFRPPTNSYILEFPAGLVDPGETLETTAIRELLEETGLTTVNGSGFGQKEGTHHLRIAFLPPKDTLEDVLPRWIEFHNNYVRG